MTNKIKYYLIPGIIIALIIALLFNINKNNEEKINLEITEDLLYQLNLSIGEDVNNHEVFYKSFKKLIPFSNINEINKINYIYELEKKCKNSVELNTSQKDILNNYNTLLSDSLEPYEKNYFSIFGYLTAVLIFIVLLKLTKKIKNPDIQKSVKFYLIFCFVLNLIFLSTYNSKANAIKENLIECFQKKLSNYSQNVKTESSTNTNDLCERILNFDSNSICLPKINDWVECRLDKNLKNDIDNLELKNANSYTKILGFYIPKKYYDLSQKGKINNYPLISLFVHSSTIGKEATSDVLPIIFEGMKSSFSIENWENIDEILKSKTKENFAKPILFDSFDIFENSKSCVTLNSSSLNGESKQRISFVNILLIKDRIMILNYSTDLNEDFKYSLMKEENKEIVKMLLENN